MSTHRPAPEIGRAAFASALALVSLLSFSAPVHAESRIDDIRNRGHLTCGILPGVAGFAARDEAGHYEGFEIDFCRAIAAAILGDADRVEYAVVRTVDQFKRQGSIDVVARRLTWTLRREAENDLLFGPIIFFDGAGFMVRRDDVLRRIDDLEGRPLCVRTGSEANRALVEHFEDMALDLAEVPKTRLEEATRAFAAGDCAALVADVSELAAERTTLQGGAARYEILPARISKEPLSLLVRQGDESFYLVVRWTVYGLIAAEEAGMASGNVDSIHDAAVPDLRHLAGYGADIGTALGLDRAWLRNVVRAVGNYGEIYDRHLGPDTAIGLARGLNALWTDGGLMYPPPLH